MHYATLPYSKIARARDLIEDLSSALDDIRVLVDDYSVVGSDVDELNKFLLLMHGRLLLYWQASLIKKGKCK